MHLVARLFILFFLESKSMILLDVPSTIAHKGAVISVAINALHSDRPSLTEHPGRPFPPVLFRAEVYGKSWTFKRQSILFFDRGNESK